MEKIIRLSAIKTFIIGVVSSIFATWYYSTFENKDTFLSLFIISVVICIICITALIQILFYIKKESIKQNLIEGKRPLVLKGENRINLDNLLPDTKGEICFLGILAKRTVNSDKLKSFLKNNIDNPMSIRFLLLNPKSPAFIQRAKDENESVIAWEKDLHSTIERLYHYKKEYKTNIQVKYYDHYPIFRTIIIDNRKIVVNFFLQGIRATESEQLFFNSNESDFSKAQIQFFNVIWNYHSQEAKLE